MPRPKPHIPAFLPGPQQAWLVGLSRGLEHALQRHDGDKVGMRKAVRLAREAAREARDAFNDEFPEVQS
jgi:hypothetical protein